MRNSRLVYSESSSTLRSCKCLLLSLLPNSKSDNEEKSHQGQMLFPCEQKCEAHCGCCLVQHWGIWFTFLLESLHPVAKDLSPSETGHARSAGSMRMNTCCVWNSATLHVCCVWSVAVESFCHCLVIFFVPDILLILLSLFSHSINSDVLLDWPQLWQSEQNEYLVQLSLRQATRGHSWLWLVHEQFQGLLVS